MEGESLYDEFGNYIGPEPEGVESEPSSEEEEEEGPGEGPTAAFEEDAEEHGHEEEQGQQVVLHEDKKYYPDPEEVYGPETEVRYEEEDAQPIEEPLVKPVQKKNLALEEGEPATVYGKDFLLGLLGSANLSRNVALVGHLHHGKTTMVDMLLESTHQVDRTGRRRNQRLRYTDSRVDEHEREVSLRACQMSLVLEDRRGKSHGFNLFDTPGHPSFSDEVTASLRLCDGCLLVVDSAEGVMACTRRYAAHAARDGLSVTLVVNKIDRLVTELRLPPSDAYHKLRSLVEEVNEVLEGNGAKPLDPRRGEIAFASARHGWAFTLRSFAAVYSDIWGVDDDKLAKRLWGDMWLDPGSRKFVRKAPEGMRERRSFVQFLLEPLYKLYSQAIGEHPVQLERALSELGIALTEKEKRLDAEPLARVAVQRTLAPTPSLGIQESLLNAVPPIAECNRTKARLCWRGEGSSQAFEAMAKCDPNGPLIAHVARVQSKPDAGGFECVARVMSGVLEADSAVTVLGEQYSEEDDEDCAQAKVESLAVQCGRYKVSASRAYPGQIVNVDGLGAAVAKTGTIIARGDKSSARASFRPLNFDTQPVVKVAVEPLNPSELPRMVEGIRSVSRVYPMLEAKVEESGEHTLIGNGELYMDSVMKDLRQVYAEVEVKVADPVTVFRETVADTSRVQCPADSPNWKNRLVMAAEPLESGLAQDIEREHVALSMSKRAVQSFFQENYGYDLLAARSVWAFGPDRNGPNLLLDDTLPDEADKSLLNQCKLPIVQGFQWACREGPLADEPMRSVKVKLMGAEMAQSPAQRAGGQLIPTARRAAYAAFLTASPRLLEPVLAAEVQCSGDCLGAVHTVFSRRRGHVVEERPCPGTPVYCCQGLVPAIESFGLETDVRYHTQGQAFPLTWFDHWQMVPGDPLDGSVTLRPLEPSPSFALARDFAVKTRRRKGLPDDISPSKYLDDPALLEEAFPPE